MDLTVEDLAVEDSEVADLVVVNLTVEDLAVEDSEVEDLVVADLMVADLVVEDSALAQACQDMLVHLANAQPGLTDFVTLAYAAVHVHKLQANCGTCGFGKMFFPSILLEKKLTQADFDFFLKAALRLASVY